jgi:hypothetical protein
MYREAGTTIATKAKQAAAGPKGPRSISAFIADAAWAGRWLGGRAAQSSSNKTVARAQPVPRWIDY